MKPFAQRINNEDELRNILGYPSQLVTMKSINYLDYHCIDFINRSPMIFISTSDSTGACDVSPRGDEAGFVHIIDNKHFVIPERPGNRRLDSMLNIIENPHVGIIFMIPKLDETLRINGKACITNDKDLLVHMKANGKEPSIGIGVEVQECFLHCAKAFIRSKLWDHERWPNSKELPKASKILADHTGIDAEAVSNSLKESYVKRLYRL